MNFLGPCLGRRTDTSHRRRSGKSRFTNTIGKWQHERDGKSGKSTSWWPRRAQKRSKHQKYLSEKSCETSPPRVANVDLEDPHQEVNQTESRFSVPSIDQDDRTELTENIHSILRRDESTTNPVDLPEFILDILVSNVEGERHFRRLLLDLKSQFNVMADDVQKHMNAPLQPYNGDPIFLRWQTDIKPLGQVEAQWKIVGRSKEYKTTFVVIKTDVFDMLLGQPSIIENQLYRGYPELAGPLRRSLL
ncbi:hypothetical protein V8E54_014876 [Elaphomyces granulatus]